VEIAETGIAPFDIVSARLYMEQLIADCKLDSVLVNLTGGTKTMSIGAYAAVQNKKASAIYVDTANEKLIWLDSKGQLKAEPFILRPISVATALAAHGRFINEKKTKSEQPTTAQLTFMQGCLGHLSDLVRFVYAIKYQLTQSGRHWPKIVPVSSFFLKTAIEQSAMVHLTNNNAVIDKKTGGFFLGGKWLEAFVYVALRESGLFDDTRVNVSLTGVENELDVLCTYHGRLALIECKSGQILATREGKTSDSVRKEQQAILNRMRALRDLIGGTFAQSFVATPVLQSEIPAAVRSRAEEYRITEILTRGKLGQVEKHVYRNLSAKL
jgi:hypothetical protein